MQKIRQSICVLLAFLLVFTSGCSLLFEKEPPPDLKKAIVLLSANYLRYLAQNNKKQVEDLIFWSEYLERRSVGGTFTKPQFFLQMDQLANTFPPSTGLNHPLVGLDLISAEHNNNTARVVFQKFNLPNAPKIQIDLQWVGRGWIVVNDSLFGYQGLIPYWARSKRLGGS